MTWSSELLHNVLPTDVGTAVVVLRNEAWEMLHALLGLMPRVITPRDERYRWIGTVLPAELKLTSDGVERPRLDSRLSTQGPRTGGIGGPTLTNPLMRTVRCTWFHMYVGNCHSSVVPFQPWTFCTCYRTQYPRISWKMVIFVDFSKLCT